jgi:hypothetical protein
MKKNMNAGPVGNGIGGQDTPESGLLYIHWVPLSINYYFHGIHSKNG